MKKVEQTLLKKESEETWELHNNALHFIVKWASEDNAWQLEGFEQHIKALKKSIVSSLRSDRSKLSGTAIELLRVLAELMGEKYQPLHEIFGPTLIVLFGKSNKIVRQRSLQAYKAAIQSAKVPRAIPRLTVSFKSTPSTNKLGRQAIIECLECLLEVNDGASIDQHHVLVKEAIDSARNDSSIEVRTTANTCLGILKNKSSKMAER
ncbi:clasp N-terminal domain-containing protein [Spinellus fusiger]|nr:clasp N-terminal domain-containing protein [Spinellus fusiger]